MNVQHTELPGVLLIELDVHADDRGSFREVWQAEKMEKLGLPKLQPVQSNISVSNKGVIRGIHAEPWDKYIHASYGKAFAAIVDIREESETFGTVATFELDETKALYVPKGFANSVQALTDPLVYTYLVTAHWQAGQAYPAIAYNDPDLAIAWPVTPNDSSVSDKDKRNQTLRQLFPHKFA